MAAGSFEFHNGRQLELIKQIMRVTFGRCNNTTFFLRENLVSRKCEYILLFVPQLNARVSEKEIFLNGNL